MAHSESQSREKRKTAMFAEWLNKAVCSKVAKDDPYAYPDVNESGFDLEEAVNPKDDLEEIMKSFDFYEN